jgi:hypothetical protein
MTSQVLRCWKIRHQVTIRWSWLPIGNSATAWNATIFIGADQGTRQILNARHKAPVKENLSLILYPKKSLTIASGATTIGSTGRAPDDIIEQNKQLRERCKDFFYLSLYSKHFLTIASGATTIGSAGRAPDKFFDSKNNKEGERKLVYWCYYHREGIHISQSWITRRFSVLKQSNKAETIAIYDSQVASSR